MCLIVQVSKVIVGAHSLLANGYVMSRVGTSLIARGGPCNGCFGERGKPQVEAYWVGA